MKILLVGSDFEYGIEQYYIRHLRESGCEIIHYPAPDINNRDRSKNIFRKIFFKMGFYRGYKRINRELIGLSENHKPDVIWIFKGMEIFPGTLKQLRLKAKLANYNPDHPFIIAGSGSGNKNVTQSVGLYHLHFCYNSELQREIERKYGIQTAFLPFGFELNTEQFVGSSSLPEINKVCFIGNPDKTRVGLVSILAGTGFMVDVYGHGWDRTEIKKLPNVHHFDAVYGKEFWDKLRQYRVQLNIFRKHNIGSHNMRSFEIPAVGGIQLTPYSKEQASFFSEEREIFFYRDEKEMVDQIRKLLSLPVSDISGIRSAARKRSIESHYSYRDRAQTVYENFKKILG
jgi:spore maturation protein CgeB